MACSLLLRAFESAGLASMSEGLSLILALLLSTPLAYFYHRYIYNRKHHYGASFQSVNNFAVISAGVFLLYLCYDTELVYVLSSILGTYLALKTIGRSYWATIVHFGLNMGFLLLAYYHYMTDSYDINWTTCQCVMTLRLIGAVVDLYDGTLPEDKLSAEQKKYAVKQIPDIFTFLSYALFFPALLVGPQIPLNDYLKFLEAEPEAKPTDSALKSEHYSISTTAHVHSGYLLQSTGNLVLEAMVYLGLFQILTLTFGDHRPMMDPQMSIVKIVAYLFIFCYRVLFKYAGCWKFAEAACRASGVSYGLNSEKKAVHWNYGNIYPLKVMTATNMTVIIRNFNINTNLWSGRFIFKRLKFFNNRFVSQYITLLFLALWHGFHPGYFYAFTTEMIEVATEKVFLEAYAPQVEYLCKIESPLFQMARKVLAAFVTTFLLDIGILLFDVFDTKDVLAILKNMHYLPFIIVGIQLLLIAFRPVLAPRRKKVSAKKD